MTLQGRTNEQQEHPAHEAPPRQQSLGRRLPLEAALLPFGDFGTVAPGFGRVGGLLRSIEDELSAILQVTRPTLNWNPPLQTVLYV
jgi:hypothetical protein